MVRGCRHRDLHNPPRGGPSVARLCCSWRSRFGLITYPYSALQAPFLIFEFCPPTYIYSSASLSTICRGYRTDLKLRAVSLGFDAASLTCHIMMNRLQLDGVESCSPVANSELSSAMTSDGPQVCRRNFLEWAPFLSMPRFGVLFLMNGAVRASVHLPPLNFSHLFQRARFPTPPSPGPNLACCPVSPVCGIMLWFLVGMIHNLIHRLRSARRPPGLSLYR